MLGMNNLVDLYGCEDNVSSSSVILFSELFLKLCVRDFGEVVFLFNMEVAQLWVKLFEVEWGYFIVVIGDDFAIGIETVLRVGLGISNEMQG